MPEYAAPVALGIKPASMQDAMTPISTMLNIRNANQQFQRGGAELQQQQMDLQERNSLRELSQNLGKYKTQDGGLDLTKLVNDATQAAPKLGMQFAQQVASAHTEGIGVNKALNALSEDRRSAIGKVVMSVADQPYPEQEKVINSVVEGNPGLKIWGDMALKHLQSASQQGPEAATKLAQKIALATTGVHEQIGAATPDGPVIGSGQTTQLFNTKPTAGPTGPVAGTQVQQQVPPTAQTVGPNGQPMFVGPRGGGGRTIPAGNPPGLEASAAGSAATANKDWESTVEAAKTASTDIANLTNIKRFASSAQTGVGADRRAFVAGMAGLLGIDYGEMTKTNTDLLAKNANMLALAGGDTNLAKTLAESANPNTHMTKEAIMEAANQVMSQRRMALAKQDFLQSHKAINDPNSYSSALTEWNKVADPRIFQWPHMSTEEKASMKHSMTAKEQDEFRGKIKRSLELGIVK